MYGDSEYATGYWLARRLVERAVRMVQVSHLIDGYHIAWDTGHDDIKGGHGQVVTEVIAKAGHRDAIIPVVTPRPRRNVGKTPQIIALGPRVMLESKSQSAIGEEIQAVA